LTGRQTLVSVTESVCGVAEQYRAALGWYVAFAVSSLASRCSCLDRLLDPDGRRVWGKQPSRVLRAPGTIVQLRVLVGIGHAGTLISAILLVFRQRWRTSIKSFC